MDGTRDSCNCGECQSYCRNKPGWFRPGEAELAAKLKSQTLKQFFDENLAVDYYLASESKGLAEDLFLLSPATIEIETGTEFPYEPRGTCVFFKNGQCDIHAVKPYECKVAFHGNGKPDKKDKDVHREVAKSWRGYQSQIRDLLGRDPTVEEPDILSVMSLFLPKY